MALTGPLLCILTFANKPGKCTLLRSACRCQSSWENLIYLVSLLATDHHCIAALQVPKGRETFCPFHSMPLEQHQPGNYVEKKYCTIKRNFGRSGKKDSLWAGLARGKPWVSSFSSLKSKVEDNLGDCTTSLIFVTITSMVAHTIMRPKGLCFLVLVISLLRICEKWIAAQTWTQNPYSAKSFFFDVAAKQKQERIDSQGDKFL